MSELDYNGVPSTTPDLKTEAAQKLQELFPEAIQDGKVSFEALQAILGEDLGDQRERFGLFWPGKTEAIRAAQTPTTATLAPDFDESVNWDETQNAFIEGDNLEVLKILQKRYYGKIKMIYIDPPYNKGKDFVYKDNFQSPIDNYFQITLQADEDGKLGTNTESEGRFHTNWLNMIYPRLKLARNLLTEDGVIFISIDENELSQLLKVCDEIFGEENNLGAMPAIMNLKGNQDAFGFAETHEYIVVCTRKKHSCKLNKFPVDEEELLKVWQEDDHGLYKEADNLRATGVNAPRSKRPNLWFPIFIDPNTLEFYVSEDNEPLSQEHDILWPVNPEGEELSWYWSKAKITAESHNLILKNTANGWQFYKKQRPQVGELPSSKPKSVLFKPAYSTSTSTKTLKQLLGGKYFDAPKPVPLIADLIQIGAAKDSIVLDMFAGSGTTGHAVFEQNARDGGTRKFILVQLPEPTNLDSEARAAGFKKITEISRLRLEKAPEVVKKQFPQHLHKQVHTPDFGFRAYKLVDTNFTKWQLKSDSSPEALLDAMGEMVDSARDEATQEELLTEVLLKMGFGLTEQTSSIEIAGLQVQCVNDGLVLAYLNEHVRPTLDQLRALVAEKPAQLVLLEDALKGDDELKTNLVQECRTRGVQLWTV